MRPILIDVFCGAGGATKGYLDAGFFVVGVDIHPQPNYCGDAFIQGDALELLQEIAKGDVHARRMRMTSTGGNYCLKDACAIHTSPPCQRYSAMTKRWGRSEAHPDMVVPVRELLKQIGLPYVIENVPGAPLESPVMLCGTMFELQTREGSQLWRHRLFETSFVCVAPSVCTHNDGSAIGVYGGGQHPGRRRPASAGGLNHYGVDARREAMGIDWMTGKELSQAIPPAYTRYVGRHLMDHLRATKL